MRRIEVTQPSANTRKGWAPLTAVAIGLAVAMVAGLVLLRAGAGGLVIVQGQVVGLAYIVAGAIAWRRRPDNATGVLLVAIGYTWYIPDFRPRTCLRSLGWHSRLGDWSMR